MRPVTKLHLPPTPLQHPVWRRLLSVGHARHVPSGATLYQQGETTDCFYYLHTGLVKAIILRPDGSEKIIEVLGAGAMLGEAAAFDGRPHFSSSITLEPSEVYAFSVEAVLCLMQKDGDVARHLLQALARKQRVLAGQVEDMAFSSTATRVARLLHQLLEDYGVDRGGGRRLSFPLTHEQIASIVGASRVSVSRAVARLRAQGLLESRDGRWFSADFRRLKDLDELS